MNVGSGDTVPAGFPKKKTGQLPGVRGDPGGLRSRDAPRLPFSAVGKRKWPAGQAHSISYDFLCAHAAIKHRLCFGTPFLFDKKGGKNRQGALHPFSTRRKDVAAHSMAFSVGSRFLCADILKTCFSAHAAGHPLSFCKERGERTVRGLCRFSLYENRLEPYCQNQPI